MDVVQAFGSRALSLAIFLILLLALTACSGNSQSSVVETFEKGAGSCASSAKPNQFIVHWKDGSVTTERAADRDEFIRETLKPNENDIEFAEHDHVVKLSEPGYVVESATTTDAEWGQNKVSAPEAWAQGAQGDGIIVAVVDSGVDITHAQLQGQLALNPREVLNGVDDDGNGLIDDVNGYDFSANTGTVTDGTGHGTHVSGIILADHARGSIKGLAPKAKLLPLDFMNDDGEGSLSDGIRAMNYAAARGAKIINASWGGPSCSKSLAAAIRGLEQKGVLFVAASGNGDETGRGVDLDIHPAYPAAYGFANQITVGASTKVDYTAGFSNYSFNLVSLVAPGVSILSTYPGNRTALMDGTSMATPFVAGAAAQVWGFRPQATLAQVKQALLASVDKGSFAAFSRGRLNVRRAIDEIVRLVP